jgi:hypothetical protein
VSSRIDHLGIDLKRQRLLVAEFGNDSMGVVDLTTDKVLRIGGLSEPQGVDCVASYSNCGTPATKSRSQPFL